MNPNLKCIYWGYTLSLTGNYFSLIHRKNPVWDGYLMAMNDFPVTPISPSLYQKLGQAYRSMLELDMVVFAVLKELRDHIQCRSVSIWLLNEEKTELECTYAVG